MESCKKFRALIDLYLDGEADDRQTETLFSHLEKCEGCQRRFEEVRKLDHAVKSVPVAKLPEGFRKTVMARIQSEEARPRRSVSFFPVIGVAGAAAAILLISAALWYTYILKPVRRDSQSTNPAISEIHIVSPREDAVIEQQYVDISAAFTPGNVKNVRVMLDGKDVTEAAEVKKDFLVYTTDPLRSGYHTATVLVMDKEGTPIDQRSWAFYVIQTESI